jgi:hypothetical protein
MPDGIEYIPARLTTPALRLRYADMLEKFGYHADAARVREFVARIRDSNTPARDTA